MSQALTVAAAGLAAMPLLLALLIIGTAVWLLEFAKSQVQGLPVVGGQLRATLDSIEGGLLNAARGPVAAASQLLVFAATWLQSAITQLAQAAQGAVGPLLQGLTSQLSLVTGVLSLVTAPAIEKQVPEAFRRLNDALQQLPKEADWVRRSPLSRLLQFLTDFWGVASRLGPFVRFVAIPVLGVILMLELVLDIVSPFLLLPGKVSDLQSIARTLIQDDQDQQALTRQLFTLWNQTSQQVAILQIDLERERAARVAAATLQQQALQAATAAQVARIGQVSSQVAPLLILATLASLGSGGLQVLRKAADCDPCAQLDQITPDFEERISALETFGEQ